MRFPWLSFTLMLILCWSTWPNSLAAQPRKPPPEAPAAETAPVADEAESGTGIDALLEEGVQPDELDQIDAILNEDSALRAGVGDRYDSGDRRDPFKSLVEKRVTQRPTGPRPPGKAGLLIDDIIITGVFQTPEGAFAMVKGGAKEKSYLLQAGDQLYDGDVIRVETGQVVFKQMINDPAAIKPFREVTRSLTDN